MIDMIKVLFYARESKANLTGHIPVDLCVTIGGQRFEVATSQFVEIQKMVIASWTITRK